MNTPSSHIEFVMRDLTFTPVVRQEHWNITDIDESVALDPCAPLLIGVLISDFQSLQRDDLARELQRLSLGYYVAYEYNDVVHEATTKDTIHKHEPARPTITCTQEGILVSLISHISIENQFYYTPLRVVITVRTELHSYNSKLDNSGDRNSGDRLETDMRVLMDLNRYRSQVIQEQIFSSPVVFVQSLGLEYQLREIEQDLSILCIKLKNNFPSSFIEIKDIVFHTDRISRVNTQEENQLNDDVLTIGKNDFSICPLLECACTVGTGRGNTNEATTSVTIAPQEEHNVAYSISPCLETKLRKRGISKGIFSVPITVYWNALGISVSQQRDACCPNELFESNPPASVGHVSDEILNLDSENKIGLLSLDQAAAEQFQLLTPTSSIHCFGEADVPGKEANPDYSTCELNSSVVWTVGNRFARNGAAYQLGNIDSVDISIRGPSIAILDSVCTLRVYLTNNSDEAIINAVVNVINRPIESVNGFVVQETETSIGTIFPGACISTIITIFPLRRGRILISHICLTSSNFPTRTLYLQSPFELQVVEKVHDVAL